LFTTPPPALGWRRRAEVVVPMDGMGSLPGWPLGGCSVCNMVSGKSPG